MRPDRRPRDRELAAQPTGERVGAVGGVVVSNPIAKNTTSRSGRSRAMRSASAHEYTMRISAPRAFAFISDKPFDAGTRIVSA